MLEWTGERFIPWMAGAEIHYEHLHRYAFAAQFVRGKRVLDLACGEGYGSNILSKEAAYVVGVDLAQDAVCHASSRYTRDNLRFIQGSILEIPIRGQKEFDVVVCFEAIEHVLDHGKLLSEVKTLLKENGIFLVSTPNKLTYTDRTQFHDPFHVKELYFDELKSLLCGYFKYVRLLGQKVYTGSSIWCIYPEECCKYDEFIMAKNGKEFDFSIGYIKEPRHFIALASNDERALDIHSGTSWLLDIADTLEASEGGNLAPQDKKKEPCCIVFDKETTTMSLESIGREGDNIVMTGRMIGQWGAKMYMSPEEAWRMGRMMIRNPKMIGYIISLPFIILRRRRRAKKA
jgi:2-polyprenyl-3-methyl-5-hydroxy-6-metoxy-1,4-benzoquinol methylase